VVGKRILAKVGNRYGKNVDEFRVLELSPSKRWTRLMNVNGAKFWVATTEVGVVEVLTTIDALMDALDPRPKD
jgi:hypothetical protein